MIALSSSDCHCSATKVQANKSRGKGWLSCSWQTVLSWCLFDWDNAGNKEADPSIASLELGLFSPPPSCVTWQMSWFTAFLHRQRPSASATQKEKPNAEVFLLFVAWRQSKGRESRPELILTKFHLIRCQSTDFLANPFLCVLCLLILFYKELNQQKIPLWSHFYATDWCAPTGIWWNQNCVRLCSRSSTKVQSVRRFQLSWF